MQVIRGSDLKVPLAGRIFLPLGVLFLAMLACGGFQVRVTPTLTALPTTAAPPTVAPVETTAIPTLVLVATLPPTVLSSATPMLTTGLAPGAKARVTASGGLNVRDTASAKGRQVGRVGSGAVVTLVGGPAQADNYTWWQVDNGAGLRGWVAAGTAAEPWLVAYTAVSTPATGSGELVNRPIQVGDRVQVTTDTGKVLTVREDAGTGATAVARVLRGVQFVVRGGPVRQDGLVWWQLEGETVKGWAAEGQGTDRWLTPVGP
jgi:hypothetical protein